MNSCNQLVHVVGLERLDVLRELILRLNRIRLGDLVVVGRLDRVELRPCALQQAVDRRRRGADGLTDLGRLPLQYLAQHEHRPLPGRQMLKGGHERQPNRLAGLDDHRRVGRIFFRRIGQRLEPGDLAALVDVAARVRRPLAQPGRQRSALPAVQRGQAGVRRNAVEPGPDGGFALEPLEGLPRAQVGVLNQVLCVVNGAGHPVAVREQFAPIPLGIGEKCVRGRGVIGGFQAFCEHAHVVELTQGSDN